MSNSNSKSQTLVPEARGGLEKFKNQVSSEMGVPFSDYNGDLTSKQCGSVGGEMVKTYGRTIRTRLKIKFHKSFDL